MKYNKNIAFLVIVIRKLHFFKNQLWWQFGSVVELRTFKILYHLLTLF
jgi:hypothetical protein